MRALLLTAFTFTLTVVAGCQQPVQSVGCKSDLDCGAAQTCDVARGLCRCIDDNACDASEFCNLAGSCQPKLECLNNSDCRSPENPSAICDTTSGECLNLNAQVQCVLDSQCPYGSYCDNKQCVTGCREDGDCQLGDPCINGQCDPTPGACTNNSFCDFGQVCSGGNRCVDHQLRDQLCSSCGRNDPLSCPADCLIDSSVAPLTCNSNADCPRGECLENGNTQCFDDSECPAGATCEGAFPPIFPGFCEGGAKICQGFFCGGGGCDDVNNPCPRGYSCRTLQVVTGAQCTLGSGSAECGAPRNCNGGGENGNVGFCSCGSDDDCPAGADASCVNPGPNGSCVVGTTCAPSDGLLCEDLR
jgi:hypothetical protein